MDKIMMIIQQIKIVCTQYNPYLCMVILFAWIIQPKIISNLSNRYMVKILHTNHKIAEELRDEILEENKLKDKYEVYYNTYSKYLLYLLMGFASFGQVITIIIPFIKGESVDNVALNAIMLTMTISLVEFRDNYILSKKLKKELKDTEHRVIHEFVDIDIDAREDFAIDILTKENYITEEEAKKLRQQGNKYK